MKLLCPHCNQDLSGDYYFCPHCGTALASQIGESSEESQEVVQRETTRMQYEEAIRKKYFQLSFNIGFFILSIFQPFIGLLLWGIFMDRAPGISKGSGIGALLGVILWGTVLAIFYHKVTSLL